MGVDKAVIEVIESNHKRFQDEKFSYPRFECLYRNRYKKICRGCREARKDCKEMLEAYRYPPYDS